MSLISATTMQALSQGAAIAKRLPAVNDIVTAELDGIQSAIIGTITTAATNVTVPSGTPMTNTSVPKLDTVSTVTVNLPQVVTATVEAGTNTGILTFSAPHKLSGKAVITLSGWDPPLWDRDYEVEILSDTQLLIQFPISYIPINPTVLGKVDYNLPLSPVGLIEFESPHKLLNRDLISLNGWQPTDWDGNYFVTVINDTTISVPFQQEKSNPSRYGDVTIEINNKVAKVELLPSEGIITFLTPHGMANNADITLTQWLPIAWNGIYLANVIDSKTISISFTGDAPGTPTSIGDIITPTLQVTAVNLLDPVTAELTFASPHRLVAGSQLLSEGWDVAGFNGFLTVSAIYDPYIIRVQLPTTVTPPAVLGTVTLYLPAIIGLDVVPVRGRIWFDSPHSFSLGDVIELTGWLLYQWNGTFTIIDVSEPNKIIFAFGANAPTSTAQTIGSIFLLKPRVVNAINQNLAVTTNSTNLTATITFNAPIYLVPGSTVNLVGWSVGWNNTYTVTGTTANSLTFNLLEPAQQFYNVWQGGPNTFNYLVYTNYMNSVINSVTASGYKIIRKKNTDTGTTFVWEVSW